MSRFADPSALRRAIAASSLSLHIGKGEKRRIIFVKLFDSGQPLDFAGTGYELERAVFHLGFASVQQRSAQLSAGTKECFDAVAAAKDEFERARKVIEELHVEVPEMHQVIHLIVKIMAHIVSVIRNELSYPNAGQRTDVSTDTLTSVADKSKNICKGAVVHLEAYARFSKAEQWLHHYQLQDHCNSILATCRGVIAGIGCRIDDISDPHKMEREAYAAKKRMADQAENAYEDLKHELRSEKRYTIMDNVHLDHDERGEMIWNATNTAYKHTLCLERRQRLLKRYGSLAITFNKDIRTCAAQWVWEFSPRRELCDKVGVMGSIEFDLRRHRAMLKMWELVQVPQGIAQMQIDFMVDIAASAEMRRLRAVAEFGECNY